MFESWNVNQIHVLSTTNRAPHDRSALFWFWHICFAPRTNSIFNDIIMKTFEIHLFIQITFLPSAFFLKCWIGRLTHADRNWHFGHNLFNWHFIYIAPSYDARIPHEIWYHNSLFPFVICLNICARPWRTEIDDFLELNIDKNCLTFNLHIW